MNSNHDTAEFIRLFSLHTNSIYTYIRVLISNRADAEDIFQETSRTLWEKFEEYRPGADSAFRAWALRIAQNKALSYHRRERCRRRLFSEEAYVALNGVTLRAMEALDLRLDALGDCYRQLPLDDRRLLNARYRTGLTVELIAAEMGRSIHSIYRALRRIQGKLFDCVKHLQHQEREL